MSFHESLFLFVLGSLFVLHQAGKWALAGEGYWPTGWLGYALAVVFVVGIPGLVVLTLSGLAQMRSAFWFVIPPLR